MLHNFHTLELTKPTFMKANCNHEMSQVELEGGFPNGEEILAIASKESLYILEGKDEYDVSIVTVILSVSVCIIAIAFFIGWLL